MWLSKKILHFERGGGEGLKKSALPCVTFCFRRWGRDAKWQVYSCVKLGIRFLGEILETLKRGNRRLLSLICGLTFLWPIKFPLVLLMSRSLRKQHPWMWNHKNCHELRNAGFFQEIFWASCMQCLRYSPTPKRRSSFWHILYGSCTYIEVVFFFNIKCCQQKCFIPTEDTSIWPFPYLSFLKYFFEVLSMFHMHLQWK